MVGKEVKRMGRGRLIDGTWEPDPGIYAPARYRRPCAYQAYVPDTVAGYEPTLPSALSGVVSDAEARIHGLNASAHPALAPLARLLLRTESIASSKVEGMQVDARALARAELRHETAERVGPETAEVLANVNAMQLAVEEAAAGDSLTVEHLLSIHHALLISSKPNIAGVLRTGQNWIGGNDYNPCGADFVPPPPKKVRQLLEDLVGFSNDASLPPLVQSAIAHAQFETIHPFDDGNGRTGRALIQVILRRRALAPAYVPPISVVLARDRDRYIESLNRFRQGDEPDWLEQFAVAAARAADLARDYLEEVVKLQERWREQLRAGPNPRSQAAAWVIIDVLPAHPVISAGVAAAATGRSRPAVDQAIRQLVEAGALSPLSEAARNRSWEAVGLLDLLSGLENGKPATQ